MFFLYILISQSIFILSNNMTELLKLKIKNHFQIFSFVSEILPKLTSIFTPLGISILPFGTNKINANYYLENLN